MQGNQKYVAITKLIEDYLKALNSNDSNNSNDSLTIIKNGLEKLQVNDLVKLFICYTNFKYVDKYNIKELIHILVQEIMKKLDNISLIKVIDLYIMFFNKSLVVEDVLTANKNILSVMSFDISNSEYIESKIQKKNISREKFIDNCKKELAIYANSTSVNENISSYLDEVQEKLLTYIDENASLKLLDLSECFDNKQKLLKTELTDLLEYNILKGRIVVYETFRKKLIDEKKNDVN